MNARATQVLALLACGVLVFSSSRLTPAINDGRRELDMMKTESILESTPPEYAFAIQAFGAFRGLLTNIAFIRAETLKQQGRYYDAMQLASWICKLQPRFPTVWEFHAWNMAWNISVQTYTPQERWNWVYNGAKLIRDEGLKYNPRAINLYKQLAWIFVNKMSATTDQYHLFYKRQWAWRMHMLLGAPPDPLGDYRPDEDFEFLEGGVGEDRLAEATMVEAERRVGKLRKKVEESGAPWHHAAYEAAVTYLEALKAERDAPAEEQQKRLTAYEVVKKSAYDKIRAIADAAGTTGELVERHPQCAQMIRALAGLGVTISDAALDEDEYMQLEAGLFYTFFYRYRLLTEPPALLSELLKDPAPDPDQADRERFGAILGVREQNPAGAALVRFMQKKVLREVYKLDAAKMADLMRTFGPMDWRVVDAHSLYWVNEGLIAGAETISKFGNDKTNTARIVFFSIHNLMQHNRLVFEPYTTNVNNAYLNFNPDLNFIEPLHRAYLTYGAMIDPEPEGAGAGVTFRTGHINFLAEAIRGLYFAGRIREASHYYEYLRETYSVRDNGTLELRYQKPLKDFVMDTRREVFGNANEERGYIYGLIYKSWEALADGNLASFNALVSAARRRHGDYNREQGDEEVQKMKLPPFEQMRIDNLLDWYRQPAVSPYMIRTKTQLWRMLRPLLLKQSVYDRLHESFRIECAAYGFDRAKAFPEPPGMDEYREQYGGRSQEREDPGVETPAQNEG